MTAYIGLRIAEWEDGQVNIGIAVCPTKRKGRGAPVIGCYWTKDTQLPNRNDEDYILPKSAFIIRPATSHHRGISSDGENGFKRAAGLNITYAHDQDSGSSDLGIMLTSIPLIQDQEQEQVRQDKQVEEEGLEEDCLLLSSGEEKVATAKMKVSEPEDELVESASSEQELQEVKESLEREEKFLLEEKKESGSDICEKEESLGTPQKSNIEEDNKETSSSSASSAAGATMLQKSGAGSSTRMKRVSWVEDVEKFAEEKEARNNSKENKRESGRKSNGYGGKSSTHSHKTRKQQHGLSSDDATSYASGYKTGRGKRNSGDKSRIPVIAGGGADYHHPASSCDYYRRKMLQECCIHDTSSSPISLADNWYGYTSLQRYAGQKVMKKFAAEQKRLEEDISNRRKTEIWILGSDLDDFVITSPNVPIRKKTTKLKPIQIQ